MIQTQEATKEAKRLTDDQLLRIEQAIKALSEKTNNAQAITLYHNLRKSHSVDEKRKWIVLFYASCYQLLSFVNMARDYEREQNFDEVLKELFK